MAVVSNRYNRSRYVVSRYEFQHGGDGDSYLCNFVGDSRQAFGVPAKSLMIQNHAGGAGDNYLYFRTIHDKTLGSSPPAILGPDEFINYQLGRQCSGRFYCGLLMLIWFFPRCHSWGVD